MERKAIEIRVKTAGHIDMMSVLADVVGDWAIHAQVIGFTDDVVSYPDSAAHSAALFCVTHVPSGHGISFSGERATALKVARALERESVRIKFTLDDNGKVTLNNTPDEIDTLKAVIAKCRGV